MFGVVKHFDYENGVHTRSPGNDSWINGLCVYGGRGRKSVAFRMFSICRFNFRDRSLKTRDRKLRDRGQAFPPCIE